MAVAGRRRPRQGQQETDLSTPAWMTTYADMIQLILCFFIALFAFSQVDAIKFQQVARSFHTVFSGGPGILEQGALPNQGDSILDDPHFLQEMAALEETYRSLEEYIADEGLGERVELSKDERGIVISFADRVLFELGKAELLDPSQRVLREVAKIIGPLPNQLRVEGHTDNLPIKTAQYPSNWELSTARATGVVRFFVEECDFSPQRLSAAGYGEYRPRFPNDSEAHRSKNRRVDVVVLRSSLGENEPN